MKFGQDLTSELCDLEDTRAEENYLKELFADARDTGSTPVLGRSPREENGNPLQYSCLENPKDRRAWRATAHGMTNRYDGATEHSFPKRWTEFRKPRLA